MFKPLFFLPKPPLLFSTSELHFNLLGLVQSGLQREGTVGMGLCILTAVP